jgi:putative heme iron utilization protein
METERSVTEEVAGRAGFSARCLLRAARAGVLATLAGEQPFASLVTPAVLPDGSVLMLLSSLASHTRHLMAAPRCALMVTGAAQGANPQTAPRVTLTGVAARQSDPALRRSWLQRHPYAAFYADFTDFAIWRLVPDSAHYVGGFAMASVLPRKSILPPAAHVAAIEQAAGRIIAHCNADHRDALNLLARTQGRTGEWHMTGVDTDGFDMCQDDTVLRVAFDAPVEDSAGVRMALVRMVAEAQSREEN